MVTVGAFEAKTHFSGILERVQKGEQVVVTKHGHPVAKIIPFQKKSTEELQKAAEEIRRFREKNKWSLSGLDWKALRDEGRR